MSWAAVAAITAIVSAGASASASHQAKKSKKHAKERALGQAMELEEEASLASKKAAAGAKRDKAKRIAGYARNTNLFASASQLSGQAQAARKMLTGQ